MFQSRVERRTAETATVHVTVGTEGPTDRPTDPTTDGSIDRSINGSNDALGRTLRAERASTSRRSSLIRRGCANSTVPLRISSRERCVIDSPAKRRTRVAMSRRRKLSSPRRRSDDTRLPRIGGAYESLMFSTRLTVAGRPRGRAPDTGWHARPHHPPDSLEATPASPDAAAAVVAAGIPRLTYSDARVLALIVHP